MNNKREINLYIYLIEKLNINDELLRLYSSTDQQYNDIIFENEKIESETKKLKDYLISNNLYYGFPPERYDFIRLCLQNGVKFMKAFHKLYLNNSNVFISDEMKTLFKTVSSLKYKTNNRNLLNGELRDWFFTAAEDYKYIINDATIEEEITYDKFCTELLAKRR